MFSFKTGMFSASLAAMAMSAPLFSATDSVSQLGQKEGISSKTIAKFISKAPALSTLNTALKAAGLDEALKGEGPFTLFAPTNKAFSKIDPAMLQSLLSDKKALGDVLLYHVVSGRVSSKMAGELNSATALSEKRLMIRKEGMRLFINDSRVIVRDIRLKNGIIHVIDGVLMPKPTIADIAASNGNFSILTEALKASGLDEVLGKDGDYTVFAPTDAAFRKLPAEVLEGVLANKELLKSILLYHVVGARVRSDVAITLTEAEMLSGEKVSIKFDESAQTLKINDSQVIATDIEASNGIVHVIDTVLLPSIM